MAVIGRAGGRVFHRIARSELVSAAVVLDITPDAFTFTDAVNSDLAATQTSNTITVSGLSEGVILEALITGDASSEVQKNGGAWGSGPLSVSNGDELTVRHTSAPTNLTEVSTTLTIGTVSDTFTSTTIAVSISAGSPVGLLLALTKAA